MRISDELLDFWADEFERLGLAQYMRLDQFLRDPVGIIERFDGVNGMRPLLPRQAQLARSIALAGTPCRLMASIDELEEAVTHLARRNGRIFEPMKHHAYPR